jgi:hypothetical protein
LVIETNGNSYNYDGADNFGLGLQVGGRYFFKNFGVNLQLGGGKVQNLVTYKFKII